MEVIDLSTPSASSPTISRSRPRPPEPNRLSAYQCAEATDIARERAPWAVDFASDTAFNMKGRIYDPKLGRFMQADPHVQAPFDDQSLNRYSYVFNNPLSLIDPTGFDSCPYANGQVCWGGGGGYVWDNSGGGGFGWGPSGGGGGWTSAGNYPVNPNAPQQHYVPFDQNTGGTHGNPEGGALGSGVSHSSQHSFAPVPPPRPPYVMPDYGFGGMLPLVGAAAYGSDAFQQGRPDVGALYTAFYALDIATFGMASLVRGFAVKTLFASATPALRMMSGELVASSSMNRELLRAQLSMQEVVGQSGRMVALQQLELGAHRVAVFDSLSKEMLVGPQGGAIHATVVENAGRPLTEGRYVGGWISVGLDGQVSFRPDSGTFGLSDPGLPGNVLDSIRGLGIGVTP